MALPGVQTTAAEIDLAALVDTYSTLLFRVAHAVLRNNTESEDVVQDAFVRVMEHQRSLSDIRDLRVWLVRIVWNLAIDRRRRIHPEQMDDFFAGSLPAKNTPADIAFEDSQRMKAAFIEIEQLPKAERQVILLSALEELGTGELAQIMGKSDSAVRALIFRGRTRLRERLKERGYA